MRRIHPRALLALALALSAFSETPMAASFFCWLKLPAAMLMPTLPLTPLAESFSEALLGTL